MKKNKRMIFYIMTIPALILFFTFHTLPLLKGIFYSFTNWNGYSDWKFIGLKNYLNLFQDDTIRNAYGFTFKFALLTTIIVNVISLGLAIALNASIKCKNILRAIFFLPNILGVLIVGFIFNYVFAQLLPQLGDYLNISFLSFNILGNPKLAWLGIVFVASWQSIAFSTIIYISGLQTIDQDIYEASDIDGANKWQTFTKITFPLIAPFFTINMVLSLKGSLMVFDQIVAMTGGGPGSATQSIAYVIFHFGFSGGNFAYQSADAVLYFIVIVAISFFQMKVLSKREVEL